MYIKLMDFKCQYDQIRMTRFALCCISSNFWGCCLFDCVFVSLFFFQCSWFQSWYRNSFILVSKPAIFFFLLVDRHFLGKWYSTRYDLFSLIINMSTNFFFKFFFISFPLTFLLTAWHDPTDVCGIQRQSRNVWAADSSRSRCEL